MAGREKARRQWPDRQGRLGVMEHQVQSLPLQARGVQGALTLACISLTRTTDKALHSQSKLFEFNHRVNFNQCPTI